MSERKDPKLKLFGQTIQLPAEKAPAESIGPVSLPCGESVAEEHSSPDPPCSPTPMVEEDSNLNADNDVELTESPSDPKEGTAANEEDQHPPAISEDLKDPNPEENSPTDAADNSTESPKASKPEDTSNNSQQDKALKKPDKIIPCPRCNSMETKFCYFNNYNVNQPRHFCKNCQRYWTAGGSMRNVPVGAGRRKNKNSVSQFRHLTVPDGSRLDLPNGSHHHHPTLNLNGTVLTFSSDGPLCESMASVLSIADKAAMQSNPRNGYHKKPEEHGVPISSSPSSLLSKENGCESFRGSSAMSNGAAASSHEVGPELAATNHHHPFPWSYPGAPWPYPWTSVPWNPVMPPNTAFRPSGFPMPFYTTAAPPPYWGSVTGAWSLPWIMPPPNGSSQSQGSCGSGPNSPTLGKHSRDGSAITPGSSKEDGLVRESGCEETAPLVPKTLRIDNPEEAAKSSIWVTLGIKNDASDCVGGSRMFKAFEGQQSKGNEKARVCETSTVLQANPAALSRSLSFHESS